MNFVIPLPLAFGFCSICFAGILVLNFLAAIVGRNRGALDKTDNWLIFVICSVLTMAALIVLAAALNGFG